MRRVAAAYPGGPAGGCALRGIASSWACRPGGRGLAGVGWREDTDWAWLELTPQAAMTRFPWLEAASPVHRASWRRLRGEPESDHRGQDAASGEVIEMPVASRRTGDASRRNRPHDCSGNPENALHRSLAAPVRAPLWRASDPDRYPGPRLFDGLHHCVCPDTASDVAHGHAGH